MSSSQARVVNNSELAGLTSAWLGLRRLTWYRVLRKLRKIHDKRFPVSENLAFDFSGQAAGDRIRALLEGVAPCMIARFGNNEMRAVQNHLSIHTPLPMGQRLRRYLKGESGPWWWDDRTLREMAHGAGFFPASPEHLERFAIMTLDDCPQIDLLGSWLPDESRMTGCLRAMRVPLLDLEPYRHETPWTASLNGRKVLVIHPFDKSVRSQYEKRRLLFKDPRVLPDFDLQVFRAVQSIGGGCERFNDWFEALTWMKQEIAAIDFEVAIIGAGAYGMPLAAFIKRDLGRKAIHLGGATQLLFGIRGKRWDQCPFYAEHLYNEAWVRPLEEETPAKARQVEGGCYW